MEMQTFFLFTHRRFPQRFEILLLLMSFFPAFVLAEGQNPESLKFFESHVRPLLAQHCLKCHGADKQEGKLRVDTREGLLQGGESGPALVPGHPEQSLLIEAINYESFEMPPNRKLKPQAIARMTEWVRMGAPWPSGRGARVIQAPQRHIQKEDRDVWCFQPIARPDVPKVDGDHWSRTAIDRFLFQRLQVESLAPQPDADRVTLIRRVYQSVIGLPPTPEEIDAFLSDDSEEAYEHLIEDLLNRPGYGEHLARMWLDLVRYAESDGYRADGPRPHAWRYRDYVIQSFNEDRPYDQFVLQQIAGDEIAPHDPEALVATGFLRLGIYEYNQRDAEGQWRAMLEDITDTTGDVFLAMGMGCAKCHDHKFDPILQRDYYQMQAFFANVVFPLNRPVATPDRIAEYQRQQAEWESATQEIRAKLEALERPAREKITRDAVKMFVPHLQAMWEKPAEKRTAYEQQIVHLINRQVWDALDKKLEGAFSKEQKKEREALLAQLQEFDHLKPSPLPQGDITVDVRPDPSPLFIPGKKHLGAMSPAIPSVLRSEPEETLPIPDLPSGLPSSGRRTAFARWLVAPENPLTARVMVNRIWQHYFGTGLVATSNDFGRLGQPPSHPELLDYLAGRFIDDGWSIKRLSREILLSSAFRQRSRYEQTTWTQRAMRIDPSDRLLWRFPARRMSAEQIRDAMLSVSGTLKPFPGGPGVAGNAPYRSIYLKVHRNQLDDMLSAFDFPDRITSSGSRNVTTTPTQSLLMINGSWTLERAKEFAKRILGTVDSSDDSRVRIAYRLSYGRDPSEGELRRATEFLRERRHVRHLSSTAEKLVQGVSENRTHALIVRADGSSRLVHLTDPELLPKDNLTVEAIVQLDSLAPDATVRTIVSQWDGHRQHRGWSLGVTSKKSAYQPGNVILQLVGMTAEGKEHYEVIPSGIHLELGRPYYIGCLIQLVQTDSPQVTFVVRDLSHRESESRSVSVSTNIRSGYQNEHALVIGGRSASDKHRWDGYIDEVRLARGILPRHRLLPSVPASSITQRDRVQDQHIIGHWDFENETSPLSARGAEMPSLTTVKFSEQPIDPEWVDLCHVLLNTNEFLSID